MGYVGLLSDLTFGTDAPIYSHGNFDKVRPGDHVRLVLWDHSMLVTRVCKDENGRTYFYATDVNADYDTCMIQWERKFTKEEVYSRELLKLDFKWMDLGEKDDRSIAELLTDMQSKASSIADAVAKLQELLGGIDL